MINGCVETKLVLYEAAFLQAAGDADRSRASELSESTSLDEHGPSERADRSGILGVPPVLGRHMRVVVAAFQDRRDRVKGR